MAESGVILPADSTGKALRSVTGTTTFTTGSGGVVHQQVVSVADPATPANVAAVVVKGTQGGAGIAVQDLKDSGRTPVGWTFLAGAGVTSEALLSGSTTRGTTNTATQTSITVTTGKTLRIQNITCSTRLGAAAAGWSRFVLRTAASAISASSSPLWVAECAPPSAVSGAGYSATYDFPEGLEIPSTVQVAISHISSATTNVESVSLVGYEY